MGGDIIAGEDGESLISGGGNVVGGIVGGGDDNDVTFGGGGVSDGNAGRGNQDGNCGRRLCIRPAAPVGHSDGDRDNDQTLIVPATK